MFTDHIGVWFRFGNGRENITRCLGRSSLFPPVASGSEFAKDLSRMILVIHGSQYVKNIQGREGGLSASDTEKPEYTRATPITRLKPSIFFQPITLMQYNIILCSTPAVSQ